MLSVSYSKCVHMKFQLKPLIFKWFNKYISKNILLRLIYRKYEVLKRIKLKIQFHFVITWRNSNLRYKTTQVEN